MKNEPGQTSFEAYNAAGANPGKTYDSKPVPLWHDLTDDVRAKWAAAELAAGKRRLDAIGRQIPELASCIEVALYRFELECAAHNGPLSLRVFVECLEDELKKVSP